MDGRVLIIPPSTRNTLNGINRYTEQAFVGEAGNANTIRNGEVGNLYGIPVVVSEQLPHLGNRCEGCSVGTQRLGCPFGADVCSFTAAVQTRVFVHSVYH